MPVINRQAGFNLIELVIGIVVFAIAIGIVTTLLVPSASKSVDPIMQVRAAELAQSLFNEISAKSFDENADRLNGVIRCNEDLSDPPNGTADDAGIGERRCTDEGALGPDGETRADYDDIDDYHGLVESGNQILNSSGEALVVNGTGMYTNFTARINVVYDGNYDGQADNWSVSQNTKLISISITTPTNQTYRFATYRSNF